MLIKKSQAIKKQISESGFVFEYPDVNKNIGMAVSEINGRVPERGWVKNEVCLEVYYVLSGSAEIFVDKKNLI
ncbi:MAG TPA: hypothetical protein PK142_02735 [bacterium]|nr:hypothetical protein [bacterium]